MLSLQSICNLFDILTRGSHLRDEEHSVGQKPNTAGVNSYLANRHFRGADGELPAETGVPLAVQRYSLASDVREGFIVHHGRDRNSVSTFK